MEIRQLEGRGTVFPKGMEESLQFVFPFAYSVSFLDPESSLREDP